MTKHQTPPSNEDSTEPPSQPLLKLPRVKAGSSGPRSRRKHSLQTVKPDRLLNVDEDAVPTDSGAFNTAEREAVVEADWVVPVTSTGRFDGPTMSPSGPPPQFLTATYGRISAVYVAVKRRGWKSLIPVFLIITLASLAIFVPGTSNTVSELFLEVQSAVGLEPDSPLPEPQPFLPIGDEETPSAESAALPDFRTGRLVFSSNRDGDFNLYLFDLVTGYEEQLTEHPASDRHPAWSPDGDRIIFVSNRDGRDALWLYDLDTRQASRVTNGAALDRHPAWSPDGSRIAFSRETVDGSSIMLLDAACLTNPDSCEASVEIVTAGRYDLSPAWSSNSTQIALSTAPLPGAPSRIGAYPLGADGISLLDGTGAIDITPAWSPDGSLLAFAAHTEGEHDVFVMQPDGTSLEQATFNEANDVDPSWSRDSQFIVFASDRGNSGQFDLYILPADCNDQTCAGDLIHLTTLAGDELDPAWGP